MAANEPTQQFNTANYVLPHGTLPVFIHNPPSHPVNISSLSVNSYGRKKTILLCHSTFIVYHNLWLVKTLSLDQIYQLHEMIWKYWLWSIITHVTKRVTHYVSKLVTDYTSPTISFVFVWFIPVCVTARPLLFPVSLGHFLALPFLTAKNDCPSCFQRVSSPKQFLMPAANNPLTVVFLLPTMSSHVPPV